MGAHFLLVEEELRIRPTHGSIVLGDGSRHRIDNAAEVRTWELDLAGQLRAAMAAVAVPIPVHPEPGQCRGCGHHGHCGQARLRGVCHGRHIRHILTRANIRSLLRRRVARVGNGCQGRHIRYD
jgi:hypothetical protein